MDKAHCTEQTGIITRHGFPFSCPLKRFSHFGMLNATRELQSPAGPKRTSVTEKKSRQESDEINRHSSPFTDSISHHIALKTT